MVAVRQAAPTVVAIENASASEMSAEERRLRRFQPFCSGVIITADGLILSQCHVTHRLAWSGEGPTRLRQPHERTRVMLSDGRMLAAQLLALTRPPTSR